MEAGQMVNDLRNLAVMLERLPIVEVSPDPYDNYLLAMAASGDADRRGTRLYRVAGDRKP